MSHWPLATSTTLLSYLLIFPAVLQLQLGGSIGSGDPVLGRQTDRHQRWGRPRQGRLALSEEGERLSGLGLGRRTAEGQQPAAVDHGPRPARGFAQYPAGQRAAPNSARRAVATYSRIERGKHHTAGEGLRRIGEVRCGRGRDAENVTLSVGEMPGS